MHVYRLPWRYAQYAPRRFPFTKVDTTAPSYDAGPTVTVNSDDTLSVSATISDEKSPLLDRAYVIFLSGDEGVPTGSEIFTQTGAAASPLYGGTVPNIASGATQAIQITTQIPGGSYVWQEAIRDNAGNYTLATDQSFTITANLFVDVLPMRIVRHSGRYH